MGFGARLRPALTVALLIGLAARAAAYPVPIVTVTSTGNALYTGEPVTIDATRSYDTAGGSLLYTYDFGDGTRRGPTADNAAVVSYRRAGLYEVVVRVSDGAGGGELAADGRPAPVVRLQVAVQPHADGGCYEFYVAADLAAEPRRGGAVVLPAAATTTLYIQVVDWREPGRAQRERLTRMFSLGGEQPAVALSNASLSVALQPALAVDAAAGAWLLRVAAGAVVEDVVATVVPRGVSLLGCRVQETGAVLSVERLARPFPTVLSSADWTALAAAARAAAGAERAAGRVPEGAVRVQQDACSPSAAVALLPLPAGEGAGLALVTSDLFGPRTRLVRLLAGAVHEARLLRGRLLLLAASGLLAGQPPDAAPAAGPLELAPVAGPWGAAPPAAFDPQYARLFTAAFCPVPVQEDQTDFVFVAWAPPGAPAGALTALAFAPLLPAPPAAPAWTTVAFPDAVAARFPAGYRVRGAVRLRERRANVYLVADAAGLSALAVLHTPARARAAERFGVFAFAAGRAVTELAVHAGGVFALAAGPGGLWQSSSGSTFRFAGAPASGAVRSLVSTAAASAFAVLLAGGEVLYGRAGVESVALVQRGFAFKLAAPRAGRLPLGAAVFDARGVLYALELDLDAPEPAGALRATRVPAESQLLAPTAAGRFGVTPSFRSGAIQLYPDGVLSPRYAPDGAVPAASAAAARFAPPLAGRALRTAAGGLLTITAVDEATGAAAATAAAALPACAPAECPAVASPLVVRGDITRAGAALVLALASPAPGWLASDVGRSALAWGAAVRVTGFVSAAEAAGVLVQPPPYALQAAARGVNGTLPALPPGEWSLLDLRPYRELAGTATQDLTLAASAGALTASVPAGFFAFQPDHVGAVLAAGGGWGVVTGRTSERVVSVAAWQGMAAGQYRPGNWSLYRLDYGADFGPLPHSEREAAWRVEEGACPSGALQRDNSSLRYLDIGDSTAFAVFAPPGSLQLLLGVAGGGDMAVESDENHAVVGGVAGRALLVNVTEQGADNLGSAAFTVGPDRPTLRCTQPTTAVRVVAGCDPSKRLQTVPMDRDPLLMLSGADFLAGTASASGTPLVELLPPNYRPPSKLGRGIPTSDNVYNADPSKPRYFDVYEVSRSSGRLKQCAGKARREECGCTDADRLSQRAAVSDCLDRVVRVFQGSDYVPRLEVVTLAAGPQPLPLVFQLTELNGRDDWLVDGAGDASLSDARNFDPLGSPLLAPNSSVVTFKGIELYHFRARVAGATNCVLTTDFMVWVYGAQLQSSMGWVTISVTGVAIALVLFAVYLYHVRIHGARFV